MQIDYAFVKRIIDVKLSEPVHCEGRVTLSIRNIYADKLANRLISPKLFKWFIVWPNIKTINHSKICN
jgi:hypothetical protein